MMIRKSSIPFENQMSQTQTVLNWVYLLLHLAVLPWLLGLLQSVLTKPMGDAQLNLVYYAVGVAFCLIADFTFLRQAFDRLLDNLRLCILTMVLALMMDYALSGAAALLLMLVDGLLENPNNAEAMELAAQDSGALKAAAIFLAPIVEEVLFRGTIFGTIRPRSRAWAYAASVAAFSLYHVWQYAAVSGDLTMLLYALEYIPVSIVLAWAYERSGSIWTGIFFHMGFNAMAFYVLNAIGTL